MDKKGFSLVELVVGMGIMIIVFGIIFTTYITTQRLWKGGFTQIMFQSRGRIVLKEISRNLYLSTGSIILNNGDRVRFVLDPNGTRETSSDDVTSEYYISGTDIMYDPDITVLGDELTVLGNVYKDSAIPFFQISGDLIVITFRLYNSDTVYGTHWSSMGTSVKMRNT